MNSKPNIKQEVKDLNVRIRGLLPLAYHSCLDSISPNSMGSAGLKYDAEGRVAWDEIWTTFCDLAMAGGPPHRGKLLRPVNADDVLKDIERSKAAALEIQRGIALTTGMKHWLMTSQTGCCLSVNLKTWLHGCIVR
jgi:hypothetical protein